MDITKLKKNLKLYFIIVLVFQLFIFGVCALFITFFSTYLAKHHYISHSRLLTLNISLIFAMGYICFSCILHLIARVMVDSKTKFAYYYMIGILALGLTSLITFVPAIFLMIEMLKPDIKSNYILND